MIAIFWFLIISPQRKQQKAHEDLMAGLKKGDVVRTTGGLRGEVLSLDERTATLKIAEKTKINVLRANIAGLEGDPAADKS
ncbi:MAG: preprotein translocase subunit YajC [Myxococcota bacterium]